MEKWEYSYLIELKTLLEKEKLLVTSNFSFSHNVFKSCQMLMRQNEYLWSKGLKTRPLRCLAQGRNHENPGGNNAARNQVFQVTSPTGYRPARVAQW